MRMTSPSIYVILAGWLASSFQRYRFSTSASGERVSHVPAHVEPRDMLTLWRWHDTKAFAYTTIPELK